MNFDTPEWLEVQTLVKERIESLDKRNRSLLTEQETNLLRGEIRSLAWLLEWPERQIAAAQTDETNLLP